MKIETLRALALALTGQACSVEPWISNIERPLPFRASELGIFSKAGTLDPAPSLLAYEPVWALYANGADKSRLLMLPESTTIDAASWTFPVGTVLVKTFTFDAVAGHEGATPVETRLLFRRRSGWDYALYRWNEVGTDATLLDGDWSEVSVNLPRNGGRSTSHVLPSRLDCRACHETSEQRTGTPVLGINPYQITADFAASPAFAEPPELTSVNGRTEAETAALGYFVGNCISCHTGRSGSNAAFSLYPEDAVEQTVDRSVESEGAEGVRVVRGEPERSALFVAVVEARAMGRRSRSNPMPPLGITTTDPEAEPILRRWIDELGATR